MDIRWGDSRLQKYSRSCHISSCSWYFPPLRRRLNRNSEHLPCPAVAGPWVSEVLENPHAEDSLRFYSDALKAELAVHR